MTAASIDEVTVIRAKGRRLAKRISADGNIVGYDQARIFDLITQPVGDLDALEHLLRRLDHRRDCAVVRGDPTSATHKVRRLLHPDPATGDQPTFREVPRHWLALDVDTLPRPPHVPVDDLLACAAVAREALPGAFTDRTCIAQATASHGFKPGLRLRLWFWLSRPLDGDALRQWLREAPVDPAVFSPVQPIYTASPELVGVADPCPERVVRLDGWQAVVVAPPASKPLSSPRTTRQSLVTDDSLRVLLTRVLTKLECASQGERHARLRAASFTVGGVLDATGMSDDAATEVLLAAVKRAGGDAVNDRNALGTIVSGLRRGRAHPLNYGGNHGQR